MKKAFGILFSALLLISLSSCMSLLNTEPTIIGGWKTQIEGYTQTIYFTEDGYYLHEEEGNGYYAFDYGSYEVFENSLYTDGYYEADFYIDGKYLILGDFEYIRTTRKAVNNTNKLAGVWENDRYIIGFAKDGLVVSQGSYMNCRNYEVEDGVIYINGSASDYFILNNDLYIPGFDFIRNYDDLKFKRKSSGGQNKTGMSILCNNGPWFYQDLGSASVTGDIYSFSMNGFFQSQHMSNGVAGSTESGTFTLNGNRINLSTGGTLIFAYIDDTPFGYT